MKRKIFLIGSVSAICAAFATCHVSGMFPNYNYKFTMQKDEKKLEEEKRKLDEAKRELDEMIRRNEEMAREADLKFERQMRELNEQNMQRRAAADMELYRTIAKAREKEDNSCEIF